MNTGTVELIVTINDVRRAGICVRGARPWAEAHGINFRDFLANGVPERVLAATGDPMAFSAIKSAHEYAAKVLNRG